MSRQTLQINARRISLERRVKHCFNIDVALRQTLFAINCSETRCRKSEACLKCSLTEPKPYECKRNIETVLDKASGKDFFKGDD